MNQSEIYNRVKTATVAIISKKPEGRTPFTIIGSGISVSPDGIIMTCRHVEEAFRSKSNDEIIADLEKEPHNKGKDIQTPGPNSKVKMTERPYVIFYSIVHSITSVVVSSAPIIGAISHTKKDIAVIKIDVHPAFSQTGYPFLEVEDYTNINEGDEIGICGFPLGNHLFDQIKTVTSSFTKGIISSIIPCQGCDLSNLQAFQLNATATYGNSGGPVFSLKTGRVIGCLQGGVYGLDGKILQGIVKAEPIYSMLDAVDELKKGQINLDIASYEK